MRGRPTNHRRPKKGEDEPDRRTEEDHPSAYLGWTLDAFDFFVLTFVIPDIAKEFGVEVSSVAYALFLSGSRPGNSQAAATSARTGIDASSIERPTADWCASSLSVAARPPRVGSRMTRRPGPAAFTISATSPYSGAESDRIWVSNSRFSRFGITATP